MVFTGMGGSQALEVQVQGDASGLTSTLQEAREGLFNFKNAVGAAGAALAALGAGAIVKATQQAAELETAFAEVSTIMDGSQSAAEVFGDEVKRLSTEFAAQKGEIGVVNALYQTLSAGITDTAAATDLLETALKTARAGLTDTRTAVDALTSIVNAYGLEAAEASRISDILFQTVREGKTRMDELAGSVGRIVPISSELGIGFEQIGAALATLTAQGQSTDEAVTAVRQSMVQLLKPQKELQELIEQLGFESGRALVESEGFAGALRLLKQQAEESGVELANAFGRVRAMQAVLPLAGESADKFRENLDQMNGAAGATDEAFATMADTAEFKLQQSLNEVQASMSQTGDTFLPLATDMLQAVNDVLVGFNQLQDATNGLAGTFLALGSVAVGTGAALSMFGVAAGGPVTVAIAGIGALALAWSNNLFGMRDTTTRVMADISETMGRALAAITDTTQEEVDNQMGIWERGAIRMRGVFDRIGTSVAQVVDDIVTMVDIAGGSIRALGRASAAALKGNFKTARNILEGRRATSKYEIGKFMERRAERRSNLRTRAADRTGAIATQDRSLLPGSSGRNDAQTLADELRKQREEQEAQAQAMLDQQKEQQRELQSIRGNTAEQSRVLRDSALTSASRCDLTEALLDPLERAPAAPTANDPFQTGGGGQAGSHEVPAPGPGAAPLDIVLEVDGKELARTTRENEQRHFGGNARIR